MNNKVATIKRNLDYNNFLETELGDNITRKSGNNWIAHSPFRDDKKPSFSVCVSGNKAGSFYDFGSGEKGDCIKFVMIKYGYSFKEAIDYISETYHIKYEKDVTCKNTLRNKRKANKRKNATVNKTVNKQTENYEYRKKYNKGYDDIISDSFAKALLQDSEALSYQTDIRKHSRKVLQDGRVGLVSPKIINDIRKKVPDEYLLERGLLVKDPESKEIKPFIWYQAFIYEHIVDGKSSRFTTKPLDRKNPSVMTKRKYWLKGDLFWNQDIIKKLSKDEDLYVVEGQDDCLSVMDKFETNNVIATIGNLSNAQVETIVILLRNGYRLSFCFDNDPAGRGYLQKIIDTIENDKFKFKFRYLANFN